MRAASTALGILLAALASLAPPRAAADAVEIDPHVGHAPHAGRDHILLGMKGVNTVERTRSGGHAFTATGYGFAGMAEASFLHGRLGVELDFVFTAPGSALSMAGEPMLKLPFHLSRRFEPYIAAGPMVMRVHHGSEHHLPGARAWLGGGQLVVGAFVWLAEMAGLDVDLALGMAHGPDITLSELTIAVGPVLRD